MVNTAEIVNRLDEYLTIDSIGDSSRNGLQVAGPDESTTVAFAVDYSSGAVRRAAEIGAGLLIVHHGILWGREQAVTGLFYRRLREMFELGVGLYAAHLPLDIHPEIGNAVVVSRLLGLRAVEPFGLSHGLFVGLKGELAESTTGEALTAKLRGIFGDSVREFNFGPPTIGAVGVITGGGSTMGDQAVDEGLDAYITGEIKHGAYFTGLEGRVNLYSCGHYATETLGIRALMEYVGERFGVATAFFDIPTGL